MRFFANGFTQTRGIKGIPPGVDGGAVRMPSVTHMCLYSFVQAHGDARTSEALHPGALNNTFFSWHP